MKIGNKVKFQWGKRQRIGQIVDYYYGWWQVLVIPETKGYSFFKINELILVHQDSEIGKVKGDGGNKIA